MVARFSEFLDYLLEEGIPALRNALYNLADWINDFSANLYEMFTFPGVLEKVILLGQEIAEAFNDFVNWIDWLTLGGALGAGLNLALNFLVSMVYTFDWTNLGTRLAEMVNAAISMIDFSVVGQWLWAKFKIGLETFAGFFNTLNMPQLATAATNLVMGLFESIQGTIDEIDWGSIGTQISDFFTNIDWGSLAETGSNIAMGIFDSITEVINGLDWADIGVQIADFLINVDWVGIAESIWNTVATAFGAAITILTMTIYTLGSDIIAGLIQGMTDSGFLADPLTWINEHIVQPFIEGFCELFGIDSPSTVMAEFGEYLIEGLVEGIENMYQSVIDMFDEIYNKISDVWQNVLTISTTLWTTITTTLNTVWTNLKTSVSNAFTTIKTTISTIWDSIKTTTSSTWNSIKTSLTNVLNSIKTSFMNIWTSIKNTVKDSINGIIGFINNLVSGVVSGINSVIDAINSINVSIPEWVPGFGGLSWSPGLSNISAPASIPYLAQGAVIQGANPFLAVLGDQRAGQTNIETPLDTMIEAFNMAMDMRGDTGYGNQSLEVNFYVEGKQFAQATLDNFIDEANRRGGIDIDLIGSAAT